MRRTSTRAISQDRKMSNPAQRLHKILTRSKQKDLQHKQMLVGWRAVLSLDDDVDDLIVISKIGKVFTLPSIITTQIRRFPDIPEELFLGWRKDLSSAFRGIHFNTSFGEFSTRCLIHYLLPLAFARTSYTGVCLRRMSLERSLKPSASLLGHYTRKFSNPICRLISLAIYSIICISLLKPSTILKSQARLV